MCANPQAELSKLYNVFDNSQAAPVGHIYAPGEEIALLNAKIHFKGALRVTPFDSSLPGGWSNG